MIAPGEDITGADKAAMLMLVLGESDAADVLRHLDPDEVQQIGESMAKVSHLSKSEAIAILEHYEDVCKDKTSIGLNVDSYITNVFTDALGNEKAPTLIDQVLEKSESSLLEQLTWMSCAAITEIIQHEHPQLIAITLACLEAERGADVLAQLPESVQKDVVKRVALLDEIPAKALEQLDEILRDGLQLNPSSKATQLDGPRKLAEMITCIEAEKEQALLEEVQNMDVDLAVQIQDLMFVFDNIIDLSDKDMQRCMRDVSSEVLTLCLKGASQQVSEKIFKNMSSRAGQMIREDLETRGPVKVADVEQAQKEYLSVVRTLSESGEITLGQNSRDYI